jgi:heavy metal sensor kinase
LLQRSVDATEYHELQERADDVQVLLTREGPPRTFEQIRGDFEEVYDFKDEGKYLQVRDEAGHWIFRSKRMIAMNPALPAPAGLPGGGQIAEFKQGIHRVRVLDYPATVRGTRYSVQTGIAIDKSTALVARFRNDMLLLTPLVILLAAAGGHMMSRKALQPVAALSAEAQRINDRNLDLRMPVPCAKDEIFDLSQTLNQMLERIDKAFASIRTFTGNASHELRTPITLLRTEIEVALYRPREGEEYREILGHLHKETLRMTSLVENLLFLARADGGAETIALSSIQVSALLRQAAETWKSAMNHAMLDFETAIPEGDPAVLGDAHGIQRLLSILLENACKFTPPGGAVTLSASVEGERIVLSVRDTGIGIDPEHQPRIFDRFYRAAQASENAPAGSGLGLALAKWIAERHGTELSVESATGHGSCFSFSLLRVAFAPPAVDASCSPKPESESVIDAL